MTNDYFMFSEFSRLTIGPGKTVLRPYKEIKNDIMSQNAKYAVIRSLFESDRINSILNDFQP